MKFFSLHEDFLGFFASMLCAAHCVVLPVILAAGLYSGMSWLASPVIEWTMIVLAVGIASWALIRAYLVHHRNIQPILLSISGFLLIAFGHSFDGHSHMIVGLGGMLIAAAHLHNWRLRMC